MFRVLIVISWVDDMLLIGTLRTRRFLIEWLSWTRRGIERSLVLTYFVFLTAGLFIGKRHGWMMSGAMVLFAFASGGMWVETLKDDRARFSKMLNLQWIVVRMAMVIFVGLPYFVILAIDPGWVTVPLLIGNTAFCLLHYSTSLPDSGEPGRRRKLALDKVKALFGGSWMPVPEPRPV